MYKVAIKPFNNKVFYDNKVFRIDSGDNIFFNLDKKLKSKIDLRTIDKFENYNDLDLIVYCDVPYFQDVFGWIRLLKNRKNSVLICFESVLVNPFSSMWFNKYLFNRVYTWDKSKVDNEKIHRFYVPQVSYNLPKARKKVRRKGDICMINSNKSTPLMFRLISFKTKDLYKERLDLLRLLEKKKYRKHFDLFGRGWNTKRSGIGKGTNETFKNYKGRVDDKLSTLTNYKFSVCYENSAREGYVTEKIFDCFKSGTVPIYLGAQDIKSYVDKDTFIDRRDYSSDEEMLDYVLDMSHKKWLEYHKRIMKYLSKVIKDGKYFEEGFANIIYENLN